MSNLALFAALFALVGLVLLVYGFAALARRRALGGTVRLLLGFACLGLGALAGVLALGSFGYAALFAEQIAAVVRTETLGPQRYRATFSFPEGETRTFDLAGDQLYVDARILKWHPWLTAAGVDTAYQLERVAGRYLTLDDEQTAPRSVHALADAPPLDLFAITERFPALKQLVDAEYGSATFLEVEDGAGYELRVSSSGLLLRKLERAP